MESAGTSIADIFDRNPRCNNDMKFTLVKFYGILLGLGWLLLQPTALTDAQEMEVVAGGELEYQNHCAVCHGADAKGGGIMSKYMTLKPTDLTQLSKRSGDKFPFWQVYRTIDGREEVRGHGISQMPVWGPRFRSEASGSEPVAKSQVAGRILSLVFYLQYIQE
jgi:mono/diheme cytochrome c family protein